MGVSQCSHPFVMSSIAFYAPKKQHLVDLTASAFEKIGNAYASHRRGSHFR